MRLSSLSLPVLALALVLGGHAAPAQEAAGYEPAEGNSVVVYTHRFKAESFEEGVKLVKDGFTAAQAQLGQTRRNYFLVNPTTYDVVVVSFFGEGMSVDEWHQFVGRVDVLEKLEPMRRSPLELERFTVDAITEAP